MSAESEELYPPLCQSVYATVLLTLGTMVSLIDRQVLNLLVEPMRHDLGITDTQISLLQGLAFIVLYSSAGLILGYVVDRSSRRNLIIACLFVWSAMTAFCGLARSFSQLFAARVGVGLGEAGMHPAAWSLSCDYFEPRHRGKAFAMIAIGGSLGSGLSLVGGGLLYAWLAAPGNALIAAFPALSPWQMAFVIAGLPGMVIALLFLTVQEPARKGSISAPGTISTSVKPLLEFFRTKKDLLGPLVAHYALFTMCIYAIWGWTPVMYMRVFGVSIAEAGLISGAIILTGILGSVLAGFLGDRWTRRHSKGRRLRSTFLSVMISAPATLVWFLSKNLWISVTGGVVAWAMISVAVTAAPIVLADIVPSSLRGRVASVYLLIVTIFGAVGGPTIVAVLTDSVFLNPRLVNYSLTAVTVPSLLLSLILAAAVFRRYTAEVESFEAR